MIVGIAAAILVLVWTEVDVEDLADALDVHNLSHRLAAGVDGDHVIACVDEIADSGAPEEATSATAALYAYTASATDRRLSGAKIYFSRRATASLTFEASASRVRSARGAQRIITLAPHPGSDNAVAHPGRAKRLRPAA